MAPACTQCKGRARYRAVHGLFCGTECQAAHWQMLGEEAQAYYVQVARVDLRRVDLSKEDMGRAAWVFLHSVANRLENAPGTQALSDEARYDARSLVALLTRLYPCEMCRAHFAEMVAAHPPATESAEAFQRWLCDRHNDVNRRLGKPLVPFDEAPRLGCALDNYEK